ncbi:hypothetical protein SEA_KOKO_48 [Mycobacterium phage Koko]|uniref:Uncharacterized protein n=3 Tax=Gladiatorvirus TaxID=2948726 RepID=G8I690_9CAUD|nr:hypothetical protein CL99_gp066 [Mycobacterium phage Blue7]YP_009636563.1 hypothetical protein FGG22_gp068 [Mycobacterium phage Hammer]YP_010061370.1 hypothetical protein KIP56_gp066 [Mycobacterium phage Koko]UQS94617.1 hypothetical protein SEA_RIFTER_48 [Mycobacterium Phage Rifter]WRQ08653.1 hypothetical protein JDBV06_00110 [Mycobacterium phage miche]AEK08693.1 hypothetical protein HAMMER_48 [Mycobacterium phage Hammer]AER48234.1 hypothetical protein BLUE7_49 [Mycobacterium phage Blue7]
MKFLLTDSTPNGQLQLTFEGLQQDEAIELVKHASELVKARKDPMVEALKRSMSAPNPYL